CELGDAVAAQTERRRELFQLGELREIANRELPGVAELEALELRQAQQRLRRTIGRDAAQQQLFELLGQPLVQLVLSVGFEQLEGLQPRAAAKIGELRSDVEPEDHALHVAQAAE